MQDASTAGTRSLDILVLRPARRRAPQSLPSLPLEAATLAARARRTAGARVSLLDADLEGWSEELTGRAVGAAAPDVVAVLADGEEPTRLGPLLEQVARARPQAARILVLDHPGRAPDLGQIDFVVRGERGPFERLLDGLARGERRFDGEPELDWRDETGKWIHGPVGRLRGVLAETPMPAWDLVDRARYVPRRLRRRPLAALVTSRSCPPGCPTCHGSFGQVVRGRPVAEVLSEVEHLVREQGVRELVLQDEVFNHDPRRARELLEALVRLSPELSLRLTSGLRGDRLDGELCVLLARAGLRAVDIQVETAVPRLQRLLKLNLDVAEVARGVERLTHAGIIVRGTFRFGWPTETADDRRATARFARRSAFHRARFAPASESPMRPLAFTSEVDEVRTCRRAALGFHVSPARAAAWGAWALARGRR